MTMTEAVLQRDGGPIHYWVGGLENRPLVVFTHGATMDHRMFDAQVAALLPEYRVLTWDVRGHGKSQPLGSGFDLRACADDLFALMDAVGVEKAVLVGHSMGGYITQYAYLKHPERVLAVGIIGAINVTLPYSRWEILMLKASMPMIGLWPYGNFTQAVAKSTATKPDVQRYALEAIRQIKRDDFLTIWKAFTLAIDDTGIPGHHIRVPLLITHGEHDKLGGGRIKTQAPQWAAQEPDARYQVIPDAGHNANQDNPAYFNKELLEFLQQAVPQSSTP